MTLEENSVHFFTIVSKNYLHYAVVLMESLADKVPGARKTVFLCDRLDGLDVAEFQFNIVELEKLPIPNIDKMLYQYSILELNTAIKPFVFSFLFSQAGAKKIIYFDPDICVYSSLSQMIEMLDVYDVLLTPHLTDFLDDDCQPSDLSILQSGTYNLGFLALRVGNETEKLLSWWGGKLLRDCVVDIPRGLFTDQKWMDLVPGIFPKTAIVRNPGWNVAYWNLKHREIVKSSNWLVNGEPLVFFHFSGYVIGDDRVSKHQDRFYLRKMAPAVRHLFSDYAQAVQCAGQAKFSQLPYAFDCLSDGTPLPNSGRILLRQQLDWSAPLPDLRTEEGASLIVGLLNEPVDSRQPVVSRLAQVLYQRRPDLQKAFPDYLGSQRKSFCEWFFQNASQEEKIAPVFILSLSAVSSDAQTPSQGSVVEQKNFHQRIYQLAWYCRAMVRPFIAPETRARIRNYLLSHAYRAPEVRQTTASQSTVQPYGLNGINVIGYVRAESGVGESARSMLRALTAASIPCSVVEFRAGNVSRMEEQIDMKIEQGKRYGINLFHVNADQVLFARDTLGRDYFTNAYRIGYWAWELPDFPNKWPEAFDCLDEIWVPSTFCQRAIAYRSPLPVICVPHAIEVDRKVVSDRNRFGLEPDALVFFTMADMLSVPERKNPLGAVEAFSRAFPRGDEAVTLVVKISNGSARPDVLSALQRYAEKLPTIQLIDGYLDRETLYTLIESSDVFVSLHRSEGFGLGIAEAMSRAKVVLATGWSGNMDFMNNQNSLVVPYQLTELEKDLGPYPRGSQWAEPDLEAATEQMQHLLRDRSLLETLGRQARIDAETYLSPGAVGKIVSKRLEALRKFLS